MEELVDILGCKVGLLPSKYLGLPLGATFKSTTMRDFGGRVDGKKAHKVEETKFVQGGVV